MSTTNDNLVDRNARFILDALIEAGKLKKEDVEEVLAIHPTETEAILVDRFHSMFCNEGHNEEQCNYYREEENAANPWIEESHVKWRKRFNEVRRKVGKSVEEMVFVFSDFTSIINRQFDDALIELMQLYFCGMDDD